MKINLQCANDLRNGYVNINSYPIDIEKTTEEVQFYLGDYTNLDKLVQDESAEEIVFGQPINVLKADQMIPTISNWAKKLQNGGKLIVSLYDIRRVSKAIYASDINLSEAHVFVLGHNNEFKCIADTTIIKTVLEKVGFTIDSISINEFISTITAFKSNA